MSKLKAPRKANTVARVEVPVYQHENVPFRSAAQQFEISGEFVDCHFRQPDNEPALKIKGRWYVIRLRDVAQALIDALHHNEKEGN